jgi:hypothetical protein
MQVLTPTTLFQDAASRRHYGIVTDGILVETLEEDVRHAFLCCSKNI